MGPGAPPPLVGLGGPPQDAATTGARPSEPGAGSSRRSPSSTRSCSSSRTCTGPTTACSTSSTTSSTGRPASRSSSSAPPARSSSSGVPAGAAASGAPLTVSLSPLSDEETEQLLASSLAEKTVRDGRRGDAARPRGRQPALRRGVRPHARRAVRRPRPPAAGDRPGHHRRAPRHAGGRGEGARCRARPSWGRSSGSASLAAVSDRSREEVEEGLLRLERKEFVRRERRSSVAGETAFVFRHVLVRDVAYSQIPRARRAETHRLAAEWLEGLAGDRAEDLADLIAHHYLSALQFARAAGRDLDDLRERARQRAPGGRRPRSRALCLRGRRPLLPGGAGLLAGERRRTAPPAPPLRAGALPR